MAEPTIENIARELAASGDKIFAVGLEGSRTLRQAVATVYWKAASILPLKDRPTDPKRSDDQFGHVLSMRAEVLQNRELLLAIIERINDPSGPAIDVDAVLARAKGRFS